MSLVKTIAALEEFTEEVSSEIVTEQPTDGDFAESTAGVDFQAESNDIDSDVEQITQAATSLEDIISLVEEAPGAADEPLQPFVEKAVNVALESNDLIAATGNPVNGEEKSKDAVLGKIKEYAKKVWDMLRNFGKKIAQWIRETWAKYTDRIVKNANQAKKIIEATKTLATRSDAEITDKSVLAKVVAFKNADVGDVLMAVSEHANDQGSKAAEKLTKEARTVIDIVSAGGASSADMMDRFLKALEEGAGYYKEQATPQQAQAIKAAAGTKTYLSAPFFGGYRAWTTVPENSDALQHWNHGISKVDEVKPAESVAAPDANEIKAIAEYVVGLGSLVAVYQANVKKLDELNKELDKAASKANHGQAESKQLRQMQAVIPRIIKGPQVSAYAYATSASTAALQYCMAAIAAHRGDKSLGEKAGDAAAAAKAKVKSFGNKGE